VITTAIISVRYFQGNQDKACYAGAAYLNREMKEFLAQEKHISLRAATKKNSIEENTPQQAQEMNNLRKRIETTFLSSMLSLLKRYTQLP